MRKGLIAIAAAALMISVAVTDDAADDAVPGPVPFHGDHRWAYMEGPPVDYTTGSQYPRVLEGTLREDVRNNCIYNGSEYRTGSAVDIGEPIAGHINMEMSGWHADHEICVGLQTSTPDGGGHMTDTYYGTDWGGEWFNLDDWRLTEHIHQGNTPEVDEWEEWWVEMPDTDAHPSTGAIHTGNPDYSVLTEDAGFAMEDNCHPDTGGCDDLSATAEQQKGIEESGFSGTYWAPFIESERTVNHRNNPHRDDRDNLPADNSIDVFHIRTTIDYEVGPEGDTVNENEAICNPQYEQTPITDELDWKDNSCLDPEMNVWGLAPTSNYGLFWNGTPAAPGKCYGTPRDPHGDLTKDQREHANSYLDGALDVVSQGEAGGNLDGNWVDPDDTIRSATRGGISCDLTGWDWGYGFDTGDGSELECIQGGCYETGFDVDEPHIITGPIAWENKIEGGNDRAGYGAGNGEAYDPDLPPQYGDACGDDPNEYLIREHNHGDGESSDDVLLNEDDMYGCVTDRSKCIHDGEIYDAGQRKDVAPDEKGANSPDYEICVNLDEDIPGGEFADPDNNEVTDRILETADDPLDIESYDYEVTQPGENDKGEAVWHTIENNPEAARTHRSPYGYSRTVAGYPWETNCHPDLDRHLKGCDTTMGNEELLQDYSFYTHFQHGRTLDDFRDEADPGTLNRWDAQDPHQDYHEEIEAYSIRRFVDGSPEDEAFNDQMFENTEEEQHKWTETVGVEFDSSDDFPTENLNNSRIDWYEDNWAAAPNTSLGVGPTGAIYEPGKCYGPDVWDEDADRIYKDETVMANSYLTVNETEEYPMKFGDWINPDLTADSLRNGSTSCDLNSDDWGIGFDKGEGAELEIVEGGGEDFGDVRQEGYDPDKPHVVIGDIQFENKVEWQDDPDNEFNEDLPPQYGDVCGDDQHEYLIREHNSSNPAEFGDEHNPSLERDNIYVCATDRNACALNGEVYREGALVDVQRADHDGEERGVDSVDEEVCVNVDPSIPGGEWLDIDDESMNQYLKGEPGTYEPDNPDTYRSYVRHHEEYDGEGEKWFTDSHQPAKEVEISPFTDVNYSDGYALEDNIGPDVEYTSDEGSEQHRFTPDAVYSHFEDGRPEDDRLNSTVEEAERPEDIIEGDLFTGVSVATRVGWPNGTAYSHWGATNFQDQENVPDSVDFSTDVPDSHSWTVDEYGSEIPVNDSTISPRTKNWGISSGLDKLVGARGRLYTQGQCYGANPWEMEDRDYVTKGDKIMGNSYAYTMNVNDTNESLTYEPSMDMDRGVWVNPDDTPESARQGLLSCDLNTSDWGYGFDTGDGEELECLKGDCRELGYDQNDPHVVVGDIQFENKVSWQDDPDREFDEDLRPQYGDACGDDRYEYLIREHNHGDMNSSDDVNLDRDDIYGCATKPNRCIYNGTIYQPGERIDIAPDEQGANSPDYEICVNLDEDIPGGEFADPDNDLVAERIADAADDPLDLDTYEYNVTTRETDEKGKAVWHTTENNPEAARTHRSPYGRNSTEASYAWEINCHPDLEGHMIGCDTSMGNEERLQGEAFYTHFQHGRTLDDFRDEADPGTLNRWDAQDPHQDYHEEIEAYSIRRFVNGSPDDNAANAQMFQNTEGDNLTDIEFDSSDNFPTENLNNSRIDWYEDNWAAAPNTSLGVGPTGAMYQPGRCYGPNPHEDDDRDWVYKNDTVMANSYLTVNETEEYPMGFGDWIDPDITEASVREGGFSCDLNATDWGIGYDAGEGAEFECLEGDCLAEEFDEDNPHRVVTEIAFAADQADRLPSVEPDDQYGNVCGDDQNEYLLREYEPREGPDANEYNHDLDTVINTDPERSNIYGCGTSVHQCVYNGKVYEEGMVVDISSAAVPPEDTEEGININDPEVCLDLDPSTPGGSFYDMDNDWMNEEGIKDVGWNGERSWEAIERHKDERFFDENPNGTLWQNRTHLMEEDQMPQMTPDGWEGGEEMYRPRGYATEAICGPFLSEHNPGRGVCDDTGEVDNYSTSPWFNAGNFSFKPGEEREGSFQDNFDQNAYWPAEDEEVELVGRHSRVRTNSTQFEPGSPLEENWDVLSTYGPDYSIPDVYTTDPGPNHWALVYNLTMSVGNDGLAHPPGTPTRSGCYYRTQVNDDNFPLQNHDYQQELNEIIEHRNPEPREHPQEEGLTKMEKVFGNSFAFTTYDESLEQPVGIWVDPDDLPPEYANFSCDITGPDKGYGVDADEFTDPRTDEEFEFDHGEFTWKAGENMDHDDYNDSNVAIGDIAFADVEGKSGGFSQQTPHCGDDHKEYLIEEVGESTHSLEWTGRWGCGTDTTDCVTRTGETEYALYRSGDYANTQQASENYGRSKDNDAICVQRPDDAHGVWYSQDFSEEFCRVNNLYGTEGVRWFDEDYIDQYPHAVTGGINDDINPYLWERMDQDEMVFSTQGNATEYSEISDQEDYTPVPTGRYVNRSIEQYYENFEPTEEYMNYSATPGFCGGDDEGENIVVQESNTDLIETDFSVLGVAANPDSCVLDGSHYDEIDHDRRQLYQPGQNETVNLGQSERTISCFAGQWFDNWPVSFVQRNVTVEEESEIDITFRVINVRNTETTYEVELSADDEIEVFTEFADIEGDSFTTTLPAESTETHSVQVYGESSEIGPADITLDAHSTTGDIEGADIATVDVVEQGETEGTAQTVDDVPGIHTVQLILLILLASLIYYRRLD